MLDTKALRTLGYGLYIISARRAGGPHAGCVANTFQQVAANPPTVAVSLNKQNATTKAVEEAGSFNACVLDESATMELIGRFGFMSSDELDKFEGVESACCGSGAPYVLQSAAARFSVKVEKTVDVGTHLMFVGVVEEAETLSGRRPMTYAYYHEVLKGKTPPKAASYSQEDGEGGARADAEADAANVPAAASENADSDGPAPEGATRYGWRCTLCGHVVELDELPDDFRCPICGMDKSFFERVAI